MADTKTFEAYFTSKGALPGEELIEGDELLVLRSGTVFRAKGVGDQAIANMVGNAVATTIVTQDAWVAIGGTIVNLANSATLNFAANQYTFIGPNRLHLTNIGVHVSFVHTQNTQQKFEIGVFINAVLVQNGMLASSQNGSTAFVSANALDTLNTSDVIDIRARNRDGTDDLTITDLQWAIGR